MRFTHALPALLAAGALALAGCGGGDDDNGSSGGSSSTPPAASQPATTDTAPARTETTPAVDGAAIFASAGCASCHTLAAANAKGVTGPNLDDLAPSTEQVKNQVTSGGGGMPAYGGDLSPEEIDAVAEYVSSSAGQ